MRWLPILVALWRCCWRRSRGCAHEVRPAYLDLSEDRPGEFSVLWKTPMLGEMRLALDPVFSGPVEALTPVATRLTGDAAVQTWRLRAESLRGQTLRIAGLEATLTDALVRIAFADGSTWVQRLTPQQPASRHSRAAERLGASPARISTLGVEHILTGHRPSAVRAGPAASDDRDMATGEDGDGVHGRAQHHARAGDAGDRPCAARSPSRR